jgi:hypothetical protein
MPPPRRSPAALGAYYIAKVTVLSGLHLAFPSLVATEVSVGGKIHVA